MYLAPCMAHSKSLVTGRHDDYTGQSDGEHDGKDDGE